MDLFNPNNIINLLPFDGVANYHGKIYNFEEQKIYFQQLMNTITWKNDEAYLFGKHIITKRKVAWYGDSEFQYTYSNVTKHSLIWTNELRLLKQRVEQECNTVFNSCLLNLYHSGDEGMAWHSDDEKSLGNNTTIASLTFGAARKFSFKHKKNQQKIDVVLESGSLLVMKENTQTNWLHRLPPTKKVQSPRINLTFRTIVL